MKVTTFLAAVLRQLRHAIQAPGPGTRGAWCRKQRDLLSAPGSSVVWVRGEAVKWATWGARRGYFDVQFMDGLPYLRALGSPTA